MAAVPRTNPSKTPQVMATPLTIETPSNSVSLTNKPAFIEQNYLTKEEILELEILDLLSYSSLIIDDFLLMLQKDVIFIEYTLQKLISEDKVTKTEIGRFTEPKDEDELIIFEYSLTKLNEIFEVDSVWISDVNGGPLFVQNYKENIEGSDTLTLKTNFLSAMQTFSKDVFHDNVYCIEMGSKELIFYPHRHFIVTILFTKHQSKKFVRDQFVQDIGYKFNLRFKQYFERSLLDTDVFLQFRQELDHTIRNYTKQTLQIIKS